MLVRDARRFELVAELILYLPENILEAPIGPFKMVFLVDM